MSFDRMRQDVLQDVWLSPEFFGELVTYTPRGGPSRQLYVQISADENARFTDGTEEATERILVLCARDPACGRGGIAAPGMEDELLRDSVVEPDVRPYTYQAEKTDVGPHKWRLTFARTMRTGQGIGS